jgi:hypothetical protein
MSLPAQRTIPLNPVAYRDSFLSVSPNAQA